MKKIVYGAKKPRLTCAGGFTQSKRRHLTKGPYTGYKGTNKAATAFIDGRKMRPVRPRQ